MTCLLYTSYGPKTLRFGLSGIKGLGSAPIEKIMAARKERPLVSMKDFLERAFEDNHSTDPVSYTHLDVYKRQIYTSRYMRSISPFLYFSIESILRNREA